MESYATGSELAAAGVTSGGDMTVEAALAKLVWLSSRFDDPARVRAELTRDLRGELSTAASSAPRAGSPTAVRSRLQQRPTHPEREGKT
jgi:hypothetical protein